MVGEIATEREDTVEVLDVVEVVVVEEVAVEDVEEVLVVVVELCTRTTPSSSTVAAGENGNVVDPGLEAIWYSLPATPDTA